MHIERKWVTKSCKPVKKPASLKDFALEITTKSGISAIIPNRGEPSKNSSFGIAKDVTIPEKIE